jgi:sn-glycerol 3-phosphate transport system permease protein
MRANTLPRMARYLLLTLLALVIVFPIYITVVNSLMKPAALANGPALWPSSPTFSNYATAWSDARMGKYLFNTLFVTLGITSLQVATAVLGGYAFAFLEFPFKRVMFVVYLATLMVPGEVTIIQNVQTIRSLGWYNSYAALIVPFIASGFGAFLLRQAFMTVPRDLQDAASLDGYGHWRFLTRVVVPIARPAIGAMALFAFLGAWNQYLWPLLVTSDDRYRTVQIGLKQLRGENLTNVTVVFAGTVLAFLPIALLLLVFSKQLVRGLTAGAVKG